jgi:carboxylesterase type B
MLFAILILFLLEAVHSSPPKVRIEQGDLTGTFYTLKNGRTIYAFLGIPYAAPLTSENRFKVSS